MEPKDNIQKLMEEKDMQFRDFRLTKIETRKAEEEGEPEELVLEGVPCVFNTETVLYKSKYYEAREKIDSKAFADCDMSDVIFNYNHCGRVYARTRNGSLTVWTEEDGLHMRAILRASDQGHEQLYEDIKSGLIDRMSFAFHVDESTWECKMIDGEDYEIDTRTVTKIDKLYDVSAVDIPAYDTTSISARSAFDSERDRRIAESEREKEALELERAKTELLRRLKWNLMT